MRRTLACLLVAVSLAATARVTPAAWAQQAEIAEPRDATEFARLYAGWQQSQNPEEKIALGERLLTLEPTLQAWPLQAPREQVKGALHFELGAAYPARSQGSSADNIEKAIASFEAALTFFTREAFPRDWAATQHNLGSMYWARIRGERAENVEKAIAHLTAAQKVQAREDFPRDWAQTQISLGLAYQRRVRGDLADNLEKAIALYQAALTIFTRDAFPREWATVQLSLGLAYADRIKGERADNQGESIAYQEAALTVFTRDAFLREWAVIQGGLGNAYANRIGGARADNLEKAIAYHEAALTAYTRESFPREWAQAKSGLGDALTVRLRGERADNLEKAIAAYQEALTVLTREAFAHEWAAIQRNLGHAYSHRIRGEKADNQEKAIAAYEAALTVWTHDAFPHDWAQTQSQLGGTYIGRVHGEQADNLARAIAAVEAALTVFTREAFPRDWALAQNTLGIALWMRSLGDPADQEKAVAAAEAALTIFTRETNPQGWAVLQHLLGVALANRMHGDRADNLQKAAAHYQAALTFYTREAFPRDHLRVATLRGNALMRAGDWHEAALAYADARDTFLVLLGEGAGEAEARALVSAAGALFSEAAFAAAQRGEAEAALALASEGRARMLAAALKLQTLDLPAERRRRLDELRTAIRAGEKSVEVAQGAERAATVATLAALRREVLGIVKSASASPSGSRSALAMARALVASGGAVVVPIVTSFGGKILVVTSSPSPTVVDLHELTTERLDRLLRGAGAGAVEVAGWLGAYNAQDQRWPEWTAAIEALGPELWRLLGGRLDAALQEAGVKPGARLVWLPTGALGILPLGLARDPAGKRHLLDTYEFVYAPSLEVLAAAQAHIAKAAPASLTAIINPTGDLPATVTEGALVASHFPKHARTLLEGSVATPEAVLAALKGRTHWHFASHGTFSWEDARASALVMHNFASLSVDRLLQSDGLGRPRLVVLSACETGLYDIKRDPDEFVGLPGAFTALGAAGVVGTLWPVSDAATALLIAKFYELHMGGRLAPPTALKRAQVWMRQASNADLQSYARIAAQQGRLEARHAAEIVQELSEAGLAKSPRRALVEWIEPEAGHASPKAPRRAERRARPYAHPYYWAGFIYTGL